MKSLVKILFVLTLLNSCGNRVKESLVGPPGKQGSSGTSKKGDSGNRGEDGFNSILNVSRISSGLTACLSDAGLQVASGLDLDRNGILELIEFSQVQFVCDGEKGPVGAAGQNGVDANATYAILELVDPCGDAPGVVDEVYLRLNNGSLLSSFSTNASGLNTRLSILYPGSFMTSDADSCYFSIDANNAIFNEHH